MTSNFVPSSPCSLRKNLQIVPFLPPITEDQFYWGISQNMTLFKDTILRKFIESCIEKNIKENVNACHLFHLKKNNKELKTK